MSTMYKIMEKMDWELLREQKEYFLNEADNNKDCAHLYEGIIALIDNIQDATFNIGTGFTDDERLTIWLNQKHYLGQLVKFKHFTVGAKDAPRHPVFLGWRDRRDL